MNNASHEALHWRTRMTVNRTSGFHSANAALALVMPTVGPITQSACAPPTRSRTLRSTRRVGSMIEIWKDHSTSVKRSESKTVALRWCGVGLVEAKKKLRRVNGHLHLRARRAALDSHVGMGVTPAAYSAGEEMAAWISCSG